MKTRARTLGFASFLLVVLTGSDCTSEGLVLRRDGLWGGSSDRYSTCFYVSQDEIRLMASATCNLQPSSVNAFSFEIRGEENAGVDQDGNECGFGFGYEEPVPIVDDSFAVEGYRPSGSSDEFSFTGTFDGDSASGTTTKVNGLSRCDIDWAATRMEDGTGGTGGTGGGAGLGGLGDSCASTDDCDPNASSLGVFCCTEDAATCANNLGQCVEDCSQFSSGGEVGMFEGALCQDNNECGAGLFCCLVPDAAGNCDFDQDQSCTCRNQDGSECDECVGINTAAPGAPPNLSTSCMPGQEQFSCTCMTQNGQTLTAFLSPGGCFF